MAWFNKILEVEDTSVTPAVWKGLPDPHEMTVAVQDVDADSTGRNQKGNMIRDRVNVKMKLSCKWAMLKQSEVQNILSLCSGVNFKLRYLNPRSGKKESIRVYVGDRTMPVYYYNTIPTASPWTFDGIYREFEMNFIEV